MNRKHIGTIAGAVTGCFFAYLMNNEQFRTKVITFGIAAGYLITKTMKTYVAHE